ncbi:hypothetical protein AV545_13315 [Paenibacillus jamilae]|uniref:hypothetical protein n=1 Tax=Paenibacillus jamilae TaxID=114136 RepID=UPI0007AB384A|nr:hypothetical protein [Paenibacillus jamilae]KZE73872.1 hypothetical protein AV545_13315 [Paenibacillus jamilae]
MTSCWSCSAGKRVPLDEGLLAQASSSNAFTLVRTGGSRLRSLSLARSWKDCGLFAAQIRQSFQERCLAMEKQWNTAFLSVLGRCGILCAAPSLVLLHTRVGAGSSGADGIVLEKR